MLKLRRSGQASLIALAWPMAKLSHSPHGFGCFAGPERHPLASQQDRQYDI